MDKWTEAIDALIVRYEDKDYTRAHLVDWQTATDGLHKSGTMRKWMEAHHGQRVDTLQIRLEGFLPWAPTGRVVDAKRASYVELDGSIRDYRGATVLGAGEDALVVLTADVVIGYRVTRG